MKKKNKLSKIEVLVIYGTRPEAIKLAPIILKMKEKSEYNVRVCLTAQHRES